MDISRNYLIKGDNLEVMKKILPFYKNKVKLIYIDPPYNTGSKDFKYKDKFLHSSWLTFMKNRLEIAKQLLRKDGLIFVQIDDNEQAYLEVLMDEVFGRENKLNKVVVRVGNLEGVKMSHVDRKFPKMKEYILVYKMPDFKIFNEVIKINKTEEQIKKMDKQYTQCLDGFTKEDYEYIQALDGNKVTQEDLDKISKERFAHVELKPMSQCNYNEFNRCYLDHSKTVSKYLQKYLKNGGLQQDLVLIKSPKNLIYMIKTSPNSKGYIGSSIVYVIYNKHKSQYLGDLWTDITWDGISIEGDVSLNNGKKPEKLLERIIRTATKEGDIVMDFFAGSGTTLAVAHKMNRKYVGIEIEDYIEEITLKRLHNVIDGETTGISKKVNWSGGGNVNYLDWS